MKIALTLAAVAATGMFAAGDRQLQTPSQMPALAKTSELDFSTPSIPNVVAIEMPMPTDLPDQGVGAGTCGCLGTSSSDEPDSDDEWDIDGCGTGADDEIDVPSGVPDHVR